MMIRRFKIIDKSRVDYGQIVDGYYLTDGSNDIQALTHKGHEVLYEWEYELFKTK